MASSESFAGPIPLGGVPGGSVVKSLPANAGDSGSIPVLGRSSGGGHEPTPVFLPEKSHGQRSLVDYGPRGNKKVGHDLVTNCQ